MFFRWLGKSVLIKAKQLLLLRQIMNLSLLPQKRKKRKVTKKAAKKNAALTDITNQDQSQNVLCLNVPDQQFVNQDLFLPVLSEPANNGTLQSVQL